MERDKEPIRIAVCVSTNREEETRTFLEAWGPHLRPADWNGRRLEFSAFIHEDHPDRGFKLPALAGAALTHTCHKDIDSALGGRSWIIPRKSGAARSFPMYLAWKAGNDFIVTMDDDCLPPEGEEGTFFPTHLSAFHLDRWFRTIDGEAARGVPYGDKGALPVLLNHGLWTGVPDLDGPTALVRKRWPVDVILRASREVVPPGMWFTLCAMNVCYRRDAIPAAYNLLMGNELAGFDRFDDIWSGLFLKRISDHLGLYVTSGIPFVRHTKASDLFANLRKEALGIQLHEQFWRHVAAAPLPEARDVASCYIPLARWVSRFPLDHPDSPCPKEYFEKLGEAMTDWAALFR